MQRSREFTKVRRTYLERIQRVVIAGATLAGVLLACVLLLSPATLAANQHRRLDGQTKTNHSTSSETTAGRTKTGILRAVDSVGVVLVRNSEDPAEQEPRPRGSGVVIRKDGVVVTNFHVIAHDNSGVLYGELFFNLPDTGMPAQAALRRYRLKPVFINRDYDLALLRIISDSTGRPVPLSEALPVIEIGDSRAIQLLDKIIIIGFPQGGGASVTVNEGVVEGKDITGHWIKTSARLIHGNSGGAAVDKEGRLIGIPTKVVVDKALIEKGAGVTSNNEGVYDAAAVGFLRPAQLVQSMLARVEALADPNSALNSHTPGRAQEPSADSDPANRQQPSPRSKPPRRQTSPQTVAPGVITVRGTVRAADDHHPIAGARVGLLPLGVSDVTPANLIAWGGTNADGLFELNKPAAPGRYTIKVRALGYQDFIGDVEIGQNSIVVELQASR